jgi:hypothetical protein
MSAAQRSRSSPLPTSPASPHPPARSLSPDRFLAQHGAGVEAPRVDQAHFMPAWRRRARIDALRRLYEISLGNLLRAKTIDTPGRTPTPATGLNPSDAPLDAVAQLQRIRHELGVVVCGVLDMLVIEDMYWQAIAARLRCDPKTARRRELLCLRALSELVRAERRIEPRVGSASSAISTTWDERRTARASRHFPSYRNRTRGQPQPADRRRRCPRRRK